MMLDEKLDWECVWFFRAHPDFYLFILLFNGLSNYVVLFCREDARLIAKETMQVCGSWPNLVCIWIRICLFVWMLICIICRRLKALVLGVGIWWVFFRMWREWSAGVAGYYSGDRGAVCWAYRDEGRWYSRISGQEILQAAMSSRSTGCPTDWPHCQ